MNRWMDGGMNDEWINRWCDGWKILTICMTVSSVLSVFSSNSLPPALVESNICGYHQTPDKTLGKENLHWEQIWTGWMDGRQNRECGLTMDKCGSELNWPALSIWTFFFFLHIWCENIQFIADYYELHHMGTVHDKAPLAIYRALDQWHVRYWP